MPRQAKEVDEHAAQELYLFVKNDGRLYESSVVPAYTNLMLKRAKGTYDPDRAVDLFAYVMDAGARKYQKELGSPNFRFSPADRRAAAAKMARYFEAEASFGNLDYLLPASHRATPRSAIPAGGKSGKKSGAQIEREVRATLDRSRR